MRGGRVTIVAAALAASLAVGVHPGQSEGATTSKGMAFDVSFKPVRDGGPDVTAIVVHATLRGALADQPLVISAPVVYAGVPGIADRDRPAVGPRRQGRRAVGRQR